MAVPLQPNITGYLYQEPKSWLQTVNYSKTRAIDLNFIGEGYSSPFLIQYNHHQWKLKTIAAFFLLNILLLPCMLKAQDTGKPVLFLIGLELSQRRHSMGIDGLTAETQWKQFPAAWLSIEALLAMMGKCYGLFYPVAWVGIKKALQAIAVGGKAGIYLFRRVYKNSEYG